LSFTLPETTKESFSCTIQKKYISRKTLFELFDLQAIRIGTQEIAENKGELLDDVLKELG
jgi:hypothetical protein